MIVLLLLVLVLVGAMATGRRLFFNLTYLFSALIVVSYLWSRANISNVQIVRQTSAQRSQVGQVAEERFLVRNRSSLPKLWLEVRDHS